MYAGYSEFSRPRYQFLYAVATVPLSSTTMVLCPPPSCTLVPAHGAVPSSTTQNDVPSSVLYLVALSSTIHTQNNMRSFQTAQETANQLTDRQGPHPFTLTQGHI